VPYLSVSEVCLRQGTIQIHVYLYFYTLAGVYALWVLSFPEERNNQDFHHKSRRRQSRHYSGCCCSLHIMWSGRCACVRLTGDAASEGWRWVDDEVRGNTDTSETQRVSSVRRHRSGTQNQWRVADTQRHIQRERPTDRRTHRDQTQTGTETQYYGLILIFGLGHRWAWCATSNSFAMKSTFCKAACWWNAISLGINLSKLVLVVVGWKARKTGWSHHLYIIS